MASTKIQNLPLKAPIGAMKIPTGGFGDYSITVSSIGDFIIDAFNLATKDYVDNILIEKEDRIDTTGGYLTPISQNASIPDTTNDVIDEVAQALLDRIEYVKDVFGNRPLHNELDGRSEINSHPSTSISHGSGTVFSKFSSLDSNLNNINNNLIPNIDNNILLKEDKIVNDSNFSEESSFSPVPSTSSSFLNTSLQALVNRDEFLNVQLKKGITPTFDQAFADKIGGYPLNARLILANGDIVKNTVPNNTTDPNVDMTGWVYDTAKKVEFIDSISGLRQYKKLLLPQMIALSDGTFWNTSSSGTDDGTMTVVADDGTIWKRGRAGSLRLTSFGSVNDAATAFEKLFAFIQTLPSAYSDNGQVIRKIDIDLEGFVWETSRTILGVQGIGGLNFINGHIKAKSDFVGDYLVEFTDAVALRAYHYISWNHVIFDANRKTSCARFNRLLKSGVSTCHFLRWKEDGYGLVVGKTPTDTLGAGAEAHEFFVNGQCSFAQYDFTARFNGQVCTGTALYINTYDGHYSDFFIAGAGRGIVHDKCGLNIFSNIHIYGINEPDYGFYADCTGVNAFLNVDNCYFDGCSLRALNPSQINFTNNKQFRNDQNTRGLILLDTSTASNYPKRMVITGNHFNTGYATGKSQIQFIAEGGGTWSTVAPHDIVSHSNTNLGYVSLYDTGYGGQTSWYKWNGFTLTTRYLMDVGGSTPTTLTFDVSPYHNKNRGQNLSATVSEWMICANWQATSGNGVGVYLMKVFHMPSGGYYAAVEPFGAGLTSVSTYSATGPTVTTVTTKNSPTGFASVPVISTAGVISVDLSPFYRGAIYRVDDRNYLPVIT